MRLVINQEVRVDDFRGDDEISLLDFLYTVLENWRLLTFGPLIAGTLALGVTFLIPRTFTASIIFKYHNVKLFRIEVSTNRTDWVVTNDLAQDSTDVAQKVCRMRWKIEQIHRKIKQLTGIGRWQCCSTRIKRKHIASAVLV